MTQGPQLAVFHKIIQWRVQLTNRYYIDIEYVLKLIRLYCLLSSKNTIFIYLIKYKRGFLSLTMIFE